MNKNYLLSDLAKLLEVDKNLLVDSICLDEELYWDSLSKVSTVAAINRHYNVSVNYLELLNCESIADIFILIENKSALVLE